MSKSKSPAQPGELDKQRLVLGIKVRLDCASAHDCLHGLLVACEGQDVSFALAQYLAVRYVSRATGSEGEVRGTSWSPIMRRNQSLRASLRCLLAALAASTAVAGSIFPVGADSTVLIGSGDALTPQAYASAAGISFGEASVRMALDPAIRQLNAQLSSEPAFAGLVVRGEPTHVYVHLKGSTARVSQVVSATSLREIVSIVPAAYSLDDMSAQMNSFASHSSNRPFSLSIDVDSNRIVVATSSFADLGQYLQDYNVTLPGAATIVQVPSLPSLTADVKGGMSLATSTGAPSCTVGFSVTDNATGKRGIVTAGHCPDYQKLYASPYTNLPFVRQKYAGSDDEQLNDANGTTPRNLLVTGTYIIGTYRKSSTYVGMVINKYGRVSGYGTAVIDRLNALPNNGSNGTKATFVHANLGKTTGGVQYCVISGDSGGPVYFASYALGILSAADKPLSGGGGTGCNTGMFYTPVDYVEDDLNVRILTTA
jgi:hypothetical protein